MSLNGLDDVKVREAYEAAAAEPGGWFLLKYTSRDVIELLGRGNGGIVEIRNAIAQHDETEPLFGFLRYRRRNVIIKHLPEDCSRLVQARVTVHFNSVCDRFAPFDTAFSITAAKELKDTKLSAACSLHAASGSTSSSTSSLRRRRLMEIAEEEEEEQRASKRQSIVREESASDIPTGGVGVPNVPSSQPPPIPTVTLNSHLAQSPENSKFASSTDPPSFVGVRPPSPAKSLDASRRASYYSTARADSIYSYSKPKVKLGPRPSLDIGGRPRTSAGTSTYRPISSIPAGFKFFQKGSKKAKSSEPSPTTPDSRSKEPVPDLSFLSASIPIPEDPPDTPGIKRPHTSGGRPTTSSGVSMKSAMTSLVSSTKHNATTFEKARLKKAMQLREKRKLKSASPPQVEKENIPTVDVEAPVAPTHLVAGYQSNRFEAPEQMDLLASGERDSENRSSMSKADSGIDVDVGSSLAADHILEDTQTDSHPASPMAMSSEIGDSTKASSLSESTDETILAHHRQKEGEFGDMGRTVGAPSQQPMEQQTTVLEEKMASDPEELLPEVAPKVEKNNEWEDREDQQATPVNASQEPKEDIPSAVEETAAEDSGPALPISRFASRRSSRPRSRDGEQERERSPHGLRIPKSKFSTQDLRAAAQSAEIPPVPPIPVEAQPTTETRSIRTSFSSVGDRSSVDTKRSKRKAMIEPIKTDLDVPSDKEAVRTESNLSEDDDLMEELQSATVYEAKPMTVSKSPITPVFPSLSPPKNRAASTPHVVRTVSNPIRGPLLVPGDVSSSTARTISSGAAFLHKITQQVSPNSLAPKKSTIGSSISQRIKALEKLSSTTAAAGADTPPRAERPGSTFFSVRKTSAREPSRSPSVVERASSLTRNQTPSPQESREGSPETTKLGFRDRSGSMATRLSVFEGGSAPRGRPESIQVTARIVRDPTQPFPAMPDLDDPSELTPLEFKQSPLVVDHHKASVSPSPASAPLLSTPVVVEELPKKETIQERRMSREKRRSQSTDRTATAHQEDEASLRPRRRSSLSIVRDFIKDRRDSLLGGRSPSTDNLLHLGSPASLMTPSKSPSRPPSAHTTSGLARRLSISSRRSSISRDRREDVSTPPLPTPLSPTMMTETSGSSDDSKSPPGEHGHKKSGSGSKSRAGRFMRRLSSSLSSTRKNNAPSISPTVAEEEESAVVVNSVPPSRGSTILHGPTIVSYMGDVNVQFPDNLLWKRRTLCLDSHGFLILSAVQGVTATTSGGKEKLQAGAIKRYHLSDFRTPYTPEMEVQELPNSVCLDFVDGSGLQIACEDRAGQLSVLHVLQDAHQSHTSFGQ